MKQGWNIEKEGEGIIHKEKKKRKKTPYEKSNSKNINICYK